MARVALVAVQLSGVQRLPVVWLDIACPRRREFFGFCLVFIGIPHVISAVQIVQMASIPIDPRFFGSFGRAQQRSHAGFNEDQANPQETRRRRGHAIIKPDTGEPLHTDSCHRHQCYGHQSANTKHRDHHHSQRSVRPSRESLPYV